MSLPPAGTNGSSELQPVSVELFVTDIAEALVERLPGVVGLRRLQLQAAGAHALGETPGLVHQGLADTPATRLRADVEIAEQPRRS